jgi:zinc protease
MRRAIILLFAVLPSILMAKPITHHNFKLDNQLEVVVVPNPSSSAVSHMLLFKAGAADDPKGSSGVAHYLEHLLFKGTPRFPEGEYSRIVERLGGENNAFTSSDMTGYYVIIAAKHLPQIMELEADRMQHYAPSDAAYDKEREVILEERNMRTNNNPAALMAEAINMAMFPHHPYGTPIIGYEHEMRQLDKQKAQAFFERFYNPANAVLLLVGDIDLKTAKQLSKQYYSSWKSGVKQERSWVADPPKITEHLLKMQHLNVKQAELSINYPAPSFNNNQYDEVYALLLAEELLGNQRTGVLYQRLVRQQKLASQVSINYYPFVLGGASFSLQAVPNEGISLNELKNALQKELSNFIAAEIDPEALLRAKNQMKAATLYAQDSLYAMSFFLATLNMIGLSPEWFNDYAKNIAEIEAVKIRKALKATINHNIAVYGYLTPANINP